jgi:hypothetical protein
MCDYSLQGVASRAAKVGDELITSQFSDNHSRGFSAVGEPAVAVCLLPGTEIAFESEVQHQLTDFHLPFFGTAKLRTRVGRFRQINLDNPNTHHDAIEFPDGKTVLLTRLTTGQRATVLQLPVQAAVTVDAKTGTDTAGRIMARQTA